MRLPLTPAELLIDPKLIWYGRYPHLTPLKKIEDGKVLGSNPMVRLVSVDLTMKRVRSLAHSSVIIRVPGSLEAALKSLRLKRKP